MAENRKDFATEFLSKKREEDVAVEPCKGWFEDCEYCDKRFCKWIFLEEEVYEKIPEKPGFFMVGLKNKNTMEVVSILFDRANIQKKAYAVLDSIKDQVSSKKSKVSKSEIHVRWMVVKNIKDKENYVLCAHWINNGVLPKFMSEWVGTDLLEACDILELSDRLQKWCYIKKDPVWKTHKTPGKVVEEISKCTFQKCEICDANLSPWKKLSEVYEKDLAPAENGICMLSIVYDNGRELLEISNDKNKTVSSIKETINAWKNSEKFFLTHSKFSKKNPHLEVRWIIIKEVASDNSCLLYAHWLNADKKPERNTPFPGEDVLNRNKHFEFDTLRKQWIYGIDVLKSNRITKSKGRKELYDEIDDQLYES